MNQMSHRYRSSVIAVTLGLMLMSSLAGTALAQDEFKVDDRVVETPEQKRARMFLMFDLIDYTRAQGVIIVSFAEDVTKDEATAILRTMGLSIRRGERCAAEIPEDPAAANGAPVLRCVPTEEIWNEDLKYAYVTVPLREERTYAERLIAHPRVVWVEPELLETITGGGTGGEPSAGEPPQATPPGRGRTLAIGAVAVALALAFFLRRKKPAA